MAGLPGKPCTVVLAVLVVGCAALREPGAPKRWSAAVTRAQVAEWVEDYDRAEREFLSALPDAELVDARIQRKARRERKRLRAEVTPATHEALCELLRERQRFDEAEAHCLPALALREERFGTDSPRLVPALVALAKLRAAQVQTDEALAVHERTTTILEIQRKNRVWGTGPPGARRRLLAIHVEVADVLRDGGQLQAASELYDRAIALVRLHPGSADFALANAHLQRAALLEIQGDREAASESRAKARSIMDGTSYAQQALAAETTRAMVARWRDDEMPIRVHIPRLPGHWVADPDATTQLVREAFQEWEGIVAQEIPLFDFVDSKSAAQIYVRWWDNHLGESQAGKCVGPLHWDDRPLRRERLTLTVRALGRELDPRWIRLVAVHEMGHALGIKGHSPVPNDVMYAFVSEEMDRLTERDRLTLQKLYGQKPGEYPRW